MKATVQWAADLLRLVTQCEGCRDGPDGDHDIVRVPRLLQAEIVGFLANFDAEQRALWTEAQT